MAGIAVGSSASTVNAVATLRSRAVIEEFLLEKDILPLLFAKDWDGESKRWIGNEPAAWPSIQEGVKFFADNVRSINEDASTGLIALAIEWNDPHLAAAWAEELVEKVNDGLRSSDLSESERRLEYLNGEFERARLVELRQVISQLIQSEIQTITLAL